MTCSAGMAVAPSASEKRSKCGDAPAPMDAGDSTTAPAAACSTARSATARCKPVSVANGGVHSCSAHQPAEGDVLLPRLARDEVLAPRRVHQDAGARVRHNCVQRALQDARLVQQRERVLRMPTRASALTAS